MGTKLNIFERMSEGCALDCRFSQGRSTTTLIAWTREYDKNGEPISKDPNSTTTDYRCKTCGKHFIHNVNPAQGIDELTTIAL